MPNLFDPMTVNKMKLRNRFVRSATMDGCAVDGKVSEFEIGLYRKMSEGEIGLIVSHGLAPAREGQTGPGQISIYSDEAIPDLNNLTDIIHAKGGKIVAQFLHGGWRCRKEFTRTMPVGPSDTVHPRSGEQIRGLATDEVYALVESFVQAARRAKEAGFDGVQLHSAHSWILSAFLSPATNKRNDEWGGSPEKNANLVRSIVRGIRKITGPDYPVMIKLGIKDYHPEGKSVTDGIMQAKLFEADGVDCIEVSEGLEADQTHHIRLDAVRPYYLDECAQAKKAISVPVILVGGMRNIKDMQSVLDKGIADAISMCRPFIMDPLLVKHLREGITESSGCTSCNGCLTRRTPGELRCVLLNTATS